MAWQESITEVQPTPVVADANGRAVMTINGPGVGYIDVDSIALYVEPSPPVPTCDIFQGPGSIGLPLASRRAGDKGTFRGTNDRLQAGQSYVLVWTGCAPGAVCRAVLRGRGFTQT